MTTEEIYEILKNTKLMCEERPSCIDGKCEVSHDCRLYYTLHPDEHTPYD